jgi:hypothetical protein
MDEINITGIPSKVGCLEHQNELTNQLTIKYHTRRTQLKD